MIETVDFLENFPFGYELEYYDNPYDINSLHLRPFDIFQLYGQEYIFLRYYNGKKSALIRDFKNHLYKLKLRIKTKKKSSNITSLKILGKYVFAKKLRTFKSGKLIAYINFNGDCVLVRVEMEYEHHFIATNPITGEVLNFDKSGSFYDFSDIPTLNFKFDSIKN